MSVTLQSDEHGAIGDIGDFTLGERTLIEGGVSSIDLFNVGSEDVGGVGEGDGGAGLGGLKGGEFPDVGPPPGEAFGFFFGRGLGW